MGAVDETMTAPALAPVGGAVPELGAKIGRFTMTGVVGMGGNGIVIAARDPALDRDVAIKILRRSDRARIVAEAQAMARVAHPNTITN